MAVPGVLPPALSGQDLLVDGGVLNNVPGDVARQLCGGQVISVDVGAECELEIESPTGRLPSGWSLFWRRFNPLTRIEVPNILEILVRSSTLASVQNVELAKAEADLYLKPPVEEFGMFNMIELDRIAEISYEYAKGALEEWDG